MSKKLSTAELLSPFSVAFWMGGGLVVLLLLTSKKKTPINTVQGLPPYQGPVIGISSAKGVKMTNSERARRWDEMAKDCELDAKNLKPKDRAGLLELAADYRERARQWRAGTRDQ